MFRAGDTVRHTKSDETWVLACDERSGYVMPAGWPPGEAKASDVELVEAANDSQRLSMLLAVASPGGAFRERDDLGARQTIAQQQLMESALPADLLRYARASRQAVYDAQEAVVRVNDELLKMAIERVRGMTAKTDGERA